MKYARVEEHLKLIYQVSLLNFLSHLQILRGAASSYNVVGTEGDCDSIAEFCTELKCLNSTWKIMELDYLVLRCFCIFGAESLQPQTLGQKWKLCDMWKWINFKKTNIWNIQWEFVRKLTSVPCEANICCPSLELWDHLKLQKKLTCIEQTKWKPFSKP